MADEQMPPRWLTVTQAAQRMQCGRRLVYREVRAGRLRAARIGNRRDIRLLAEWVDTFLEESARPVAWRAP
jgi:excisionase family DNA binding protein